MGACARKRGPTRYRPSKQSASRCRRWRAIRRSVNACWFRSASFSPRPALRAFATANGIVGPAVSPYNRRMLDQPLVPVAQRTNPERSFHEEVRALRLGEGEVFRGDGVLAVTT